MYLAGIKKALGYISDHDIPAECRLNVLLISISPQYVSYCVRLSKLQKDTAVLYIAYLSL